ncbi:hypothetical protein GZH53_15290 [Flavihumibacter sp. R14]|nr:hypothetical protein [Flavihumibacter soli]
MAGRYRSEDRSSDFNHDFTQLPVAERPNTKRCSQIAEEALARKHWLFDPKERQWYSPEELNEQYGRVGKGAEELLQRLQSRDPLEGIIAGHKKIETLRIMVEEFSVRVAKYFRKKVR